MIDLTKKIIEEYQKGLSIRQIASQMPFSPSKIRKIIKNSDAEMRTSKEGLRKRKERSMPLNSEILAAIEGELLGDGCIGKRINQSKFCFTNSKEEYTLWLANVLTTHDIKLSGNGVTKETYYHKYWKSFYTKYSFSTLCSLEFEKLEQKWYVNRKKILPCDLKISPTLMLHWYLGDGSLPGGKYAMFCTDSFTKTEVQLLSSEINKTIGVKSSIYKSGKFYRIFVPKTSVSLLLEYIGPPPVKSLSYKWDLKPIGKINKTIDIPKKTLIKYYITQNLSLNQVAKIYDCSVSTIRKKLLFYNVRKRPSNRIFNFNKEDLKNLYINKKLTVKELANHFFCSVQTINNSLRLFGIKKKSWRN